MADIAELQNIVVEKKEGIARIILNRPEAMNALNNVIIDEFWAATEDVRVDDEIKVVIITGAGKAFCTGLDINYIEQLATGAMLEVGSLLRKLQATFTVERLEKPVIAAINGYALGEGCDLALSCDFRVASKNARLGMTYTQLGLIPDTGGACRLIQLVGLSKAKELIFFGEPIGAKEALEMGMVDKVVPAQDLDAAALDLAGTLAMKSPGALGLAKRAINTTLEASLKATMEFDLRAQSRRFQAEDTREAIAARIQELKTAPKIE
jgi:enoyl-CoA hydratase